MSASNYYGFNSHPTSSNAPSHSHTGRGRRAPRLSQNSHTKQQVRVVRKEEEAVAINAYRQHFEACRSFDFEDDKEFCPVFVSESDYPSSWSDQSSIRSEGSQSPENSPQSHTVTPHHTFSTLNSNSSPYVPAFQSQPTILKLHQPAATRIRNAIPIVNPNSGLRMSSPSHSVSPARMQQYIRGY